MCKDRLRVVSPSKHIPSPPRVYMDPNARGAAYHIHTIYIRRYGHRPTTLILWILGLIESQTHRSHRPTGLPGARATDHRIIGSPKTTTRTCAGLIGLSPATIWLTIGCLSHRATPVLHPRVTGLPLDTEPLEPPTTKVLKPPTYWLTEPLYHRATGSLDR
jgi:hypothetical protein